MDPLLLLGLAGFISGLIPNKSTQTTTAPSQMDPLYAALSPMMLGNALGGMDWLNGFGGSQYFNFAPDMRTLLMNKLKAAMPGLITTSVGNAKSGSTSPAGRHYGGGQDFYDWVNQGGFGGGIGFGKQDPYSQFGPSRRGYSY